MQINYLQLLYFIFGVSFKCTIQRTDGFIYLCTVQLRNYLYHLVPRIEVKSLNDCSYYNIQNQGQIRTINAMHVNGNIKKVDFSHLVS